MSILLPARETSPVIASAMQAFSKSERYSARCVPTDARLALGAHLTAWSVLLLRHVMHQILVSAIADTSILAWRLARLVRTLARLAQFPLAYVQRVCLLQHAISHSTASAISAITTYQDRVIVEVNNMAFLLVVES